MTRSAAKAASGEDPHELARSFEPAAARELQRQLDEAAGTSPLRFPELVPTATALDVLRRLEATLRKEPTLLKVRPRGCRSVRSPRERASASSAGPTDSTSSFPRSPREQISPNADARVVVVGDTHGQYHDVRKMCDFRVQREAGDVGGGRKGGVNSRGLLAERPSNLVGRATWGSTAGRRALSFVRFHRILSLLPPQDGPGRRAVGGGRLRVQR